MTPRFLIFASLLGGAASAMGAATPEPTTEQLRFFEAKIRPLLQENCYKCHSLEKGKSKGNLVLDSRDGWQKGGESGAAIVPGDVEKSLLLTAVGYGDPDLQMPPKGEKLTATQIADLTAWVKMGAPDPRKATGGAIASKLSGLTDKARSHWAYQPVVKPPVPRTKDHDWSRTSIDAFILQKLEAAGMSPAPDADKETLLRRATYDLIGLPPTPQEVIAFLSDQSPNAFSKVVDRLLASPHYGERWGRFWLDTARYADTVGGDRNQQKYGLDYRYPYAWTYRDYVINAFNSDKPYDRFILEQLAADKLPDAKDPAALAALGFLTVGERFRNANDVINDRIDAVSKGFLAMTVTCARCHDHMFDPIPTTDYYALHGVFASTLEPGTKPIIAEAPPGKFLEFQAKLSVLEAKNREVYYQIVASLNGDAQNKIADLLMASRLTQKKGGGTAQDLKERNGLLNRSKIDREMLGLLQRSAKRDSPVMAPFHLFAQLGEGDFGERGTELAAQVASGSASFGGNRRIAINPLVAAAFKDTQPKNLGEVAAIYGKLFASLAPQRKAYIDASAKALQEPVTGFAPELVQLLETPMNVLPASKLSSEEMREFVSRLPRQMAGRTRFAFSDINELELTHPGAPARPMLVADAAKAKDSPVFIRGQAETKGAIVPRHFLDVLSPNGKAAPFTEGSGRLELAQAIASKSNPLTARVMVNRVWMHHFGEGFVPTPDDLGTQSEAPSHPELLDYLSSFFMEQGWSVKRLHRAIMLSRVYQQSSRTNTACEAIDPQNRLLWRANIRRLDFEAVRDSLLVFAGKLDRTLGGKPINLTDEPYSYRRSVYGYIDRGNLPELMSQFDFSDPDMPNSKRTTTVVPQQALFLMNSPMSIDAARHILERPEVAAATDNVSRLQAIYRVIFQRRPSAAETQVGLTFVTEDGVYLPQPTAQSRQNQERNSARLKALVQNSNKRRSGATAPIKNDGEMVERKPLTPWETYAQALLLSNEAAYVN